MTFILHATNATRVIRLIGLFSFLFAMFWVGLPMMTSDQFWTILLLVAIGWFIFELIARRGNLNLKSLAFPFLVGISLLVMDLIINYVGLLWNLYTITPTRFTVLADPLQLPLIAFFGGSAWAMHIPEKFDPVYTSADVLIFGFFGTITERMLNINGIMDYVSVNWVNAFFTYAFVWLVLHLVYYGSKKLITHS